MNTSLAADLERLRKLAYHRAEWSGDLVRQMHRLPKNCQSHPNYPSRVDPFSGTEAPKIGMVQKRRFSDYR